MIQSTDIPVTELLVQARDGSVSARERVATWLSRRMRFSVQRRVTHVIEPDRSPTQWVNEAFLKLLRSRSFDDAPNRRYLVAAAASAVREVLVDHCRRRNAKKRGSGEVPYSLDPFLHVIEEQGLDVVALHEALQLLAERRPRQAEVVDLRFFGGYSHTEIAELLGVSISTIEEDWRRARGWLYRQLSDHATR